MKTDLFEDEWEQALRSADQEARQIQVTAKARAVIRKTTAIATRRAKSEQILFDVLPSPLPMDTSVHVISAGDVDALSYLIVLTRQTAIEHLLLSTWCLAMPDLQWLLSQQDCGRIGQLDFVLGEIFPSQYTDEYIALRAVTSTRNDVNLKIARNHAKVMAGIAPDGEFCFVIESSANVNTNPRIEQTAIHTSRQLYDHYTQFFANVRSIEKP